VQRVVGVAATDPGGGALVAQDRVHPATVVAGPDPLGELVARRLRAQLVERAVVAGAEHPPPGLALVAPLLDEDGRPAVEHEPDHVLLALGGLGRVLDVDAAALGEVHEHAQPGAEVGDEVLATTAHRCEDATAQRQRVGIERLEGSELERLDARQRPTGGGGFQAFGEGLHLRGLGHQAAPNVARAVAARSCNQAGCSAARSASRPGSHPSSTSRAISASQSSTSTCSAATPTPSSLALW
jgi:hypothetical protein